MLVLDTETNRFFWSLIDALLLQSSFAHRFDLSLHILLSMSLNINTVEHPELSCQLLREINIILLLFSEIVHLNGCETLVKVFKQFSVLFSCKES